MAAAAGTEWGKYFHRAAPDQVDRLTRFAAGINGLTGGVGAFFQPGFKIGQGFILAVFEELHFGQFQRRFIDRLGALCFAEQTVFDPFDGVVELGEKANGFIIFCDAGLFEKLTQVASVGQVFPQVGKQQHGFAFGQRVAYLTE